MFLLVLFIHIICCLIKNTTRSEINWKMPIFWQLMEPGNPNLNNQGGTVELALAIMALCEQSRHRINGIWLSIETIMSCGKKIYFVFWNSLFHEVGCLCSQQFFGSQYLQPLLALDLTAVLQFQLLASVLVTLISARVILFLASMRVAKR